ncbi:MAG: discoidin domain-containing protein, partial [Candidatus Moraniibacteriota bacterium]
TLTAGTNGSYLKTQGTSANPTWDTPSGTVYTAGGTLLQLNTNAFSIKEGTLTDTKYCKYILGTGIVCDYDAGGVTYTATNGITLNTTAFELGGTLTKATSIALGGFDLNLSGLGNIGIGTTTTSYKLDVRGTAAAGQINAEAGLCINGVCKTSWSSAGIGTDTWTTSGSNIYYTLGNVGIGTTSPTALLDVNGAIGTTKIQNITGGVTNGISLFEDAPTVTEVEYAEYLTDEDLQGEWGGADTSDVDVASGGTASANSVYEGGYEAVKAFDNNAASIWASQGSAPPYWLKYDFWEGNEKVIWQYTLQARAEVFHAPVSWVFQGSNNDSAWTVIDIQNNAPAWSGSEKRTYNNFSNPNAYRYYRIYITETTTNSAAEFAEVEMMEYSLNSFSEPTIKTQGTNSLKGVAIQDVSLNKTLTRTLSIPLNLSGKDQITFSLRSSRIGENVKIGIHDAGGTTTEITPNITNSDQFQTIIWDISSLANSSKDAIDQIIITIVNADADNTFYLDNMYASETYVQGLAFTADNQKRMKITTGGNVGIDLSNPLAKLAVRGSGTTTGNLFQLFDADSTNRLTVLDGGNIGIGTTTPLYKLEVNGSAKVSSLNINGAYSLPAAAGTTSE